MFRKREGGTLPSMQPAPTERVTSVLSSGIIWKGDLSGSGGVRIEGAFEGNISLRGLLVIGETGRLTCEHLHANVVIVAGAVRGDITAEKVEIRATGRVWGDVIRPHLPPKKEPSSEARFVWKSRLTLEQSPNR